VDKIGHKINKNNKFVPINPWGWCTGAPIRNFISFFLFFVDIFQKTEKQRRKKPLF
jgi:hypothetical protein